MGLDPNAYRDKDVLERLYYEKGLSQEEIGEIFDVSFRTISKYMVEHGINPGRDSSQFKQKPKASFLTDDRGYERLDSYDPCSKSKEYVKVHRLLAVAIYGFEAVKGKDIHHINSIPWDNRPDNISIVGRSEHLSEHAVEWAETRERDEHGRFL